MRVTGYLTMDDESGWQIDSQLAFGPLQALGWRVEPLPWRAADTDWDCFDAVWIGTPWDYPEDARRFLGVLEAIDRSRAVLVNDLGLVRWTMAKTYLRDVGARGVPIVPSAWGDAMSADFVLAACERFAAERIIVKPVVSTNATDTFLLACDAIGEAEAQLVATFASRPFVVQPFIDNIRSEGELSLFYFNGEFSHAIRKTPASGDFRVQEEFGAALKSIRPSAALLATGARLLAEVRPVPVYARCDFVRGAGDEFLLMELELIEPSLYLRMDENAPQRFAAAFDAHVRAVTGET